MNIPLIIVLATLGAFLGSFAVAQVWRLRARQLVEDKRDGEPIDEHELKVLKRLIRPVRTDRSECLACHHMLAWYDLIPVLSWVSLGGRCRYCKSPIGASEIIAELGLAAVFAISYVAWPQPLTTTAQLAPFVVWLMACVIGTILLVYDAKWSLLPFELNIALIGMGVVYVALAYTVGGVTPNWISLIVAVLLLGGLYLLFSLLGWVGMGDGILGVGLALFLGSWQLAFVTLFLANLLGSLMIIPLYAHNRLRRQMRIPFGPFLLVAAFISMLVGDILIAATFSASDDVFNALML